MNCIVDIVQIEPVAMMQLAADTNFGNEIARVVHLKVNPTFLRQS